MEGWECFFNWNHSHNLPINNQSIRKPFSGKTSNMHRQTNSLKVFQIFSLLIMGVSLNVWGNELLRRGLRSLRTLLFLVLFHEEIWQKMLPNNKRHILWYILWPRLLLHPLDALDDTINWVPFHTIPMCKILKTSQHIWHSVTQQSMFTLQITWGNVLFSTLSI